jgi:hypothetical protein
VSPDGQESDCLQFGSAALVLKWVRPFWWLRIWLGSIVIAADNVPPIGCMVGYPRLGEAGTEPDAATRARRSIGQLGWSKPL